LMSLKKVGLGAFLAAEEIVEDDDMDSVAGEGPRTELLEARHEFTGGTART
jgi:hypothetical protein